MQKILVVRFSSIGDIVLTSPVVRWLKKQLEAEVHFLCKKAFLPLVKANPFIDRVHVLESDWAGLVRALRKEDFDLVVDLHRNLRTARLTWALNKQRITFDKLNLEKWLMVNFKLDRLPRLHLVDRYLQAVQPLGVADDGAGLDYFIPPEEEVEPESWLPRGSTEYVAFAIGAAHATKRMPPPRIVEICRQIRLPVVLLGGPGDRESGRRIAREAGEQVVNSCGHLSVNQSASLVRQAQRVITHDTGMMHIAAAFNKEIISIWGNTVPEFGMYPYFSKGKGLEHRMEVRGLSCRPCSKIGSARCPKQHFRCMEDQDTGLIASLADRDRLER